MFESSSTIEAQQLSPEERLKQCIEKLKNLSDEIQAAVKDEKDEEVKKQKLVKIREQKCSESLVWMEELRPLIESGNGNFSRETKGQIDTYLFNITGFEKKDPITSHYLVNILISIRRRVQEIAEKTKTTPDYLLEGEFL